jgi:hypothetical protein
MKTHMSVTAVLLALICLLFTGCGFGTPGQGEKIGQIVKVNRQGIIRDTYEAELIRGGMSGGSGTIGATAFDFTIEDADLAKKAQEFMKNQTEVVIKYRMEGVYSALRTSSRGHFLVSIEAAKK